jgi:hypothetical protein
MSRFLRERILEIARQMTTPQKEKMTMGTKVATETKSNASPTAIRQAFHTTRRLIVAFIALSAATLVAAFFLSRSDPTLVSSTVWTRATIVLLDSLVALSYAKKASRGLAKAYRNLRLLSAGSVVGVVVLVVWPGLLPGWMKLEQAVCGLLLLGVVVLINSGKVRALFADCAVARPAVPSGQA